MLCFRIVHLTRGEHPGPLGPPASVLCSEKQTNGAHCPLLTGQFNRCTLPHFLGLKVQLITQTQRHSDHFESKQSVVASLQCSEQ